MSKYNGAEGIIASFSFILFVLSWILWSTSYEVVLELDKDKHPVEGPIYYYIYIDSEGEDEHEDR
ncbi:hypothetical protein IGI04_021952 [Brassica rapa subsp. trilocularis]|uniref:Uncharacterized protein n=1 Tax=Brassica rapa subsp. trilocularis TaxID=1813537 RepID=A0ABQ7LZL4_BRACM|nr:hypothetical protein IGI04_021952 [Brassica rapa subsp. trilocularis]